MKINILIIDDESIARQRVVHLLRDCKEDFDIREAPDAIAAGEILAGFKPHLIYLDINMPVYSGFDFLKQHNLEHTFVIFQTAYSEYAVQAFECDAENYLLKPFSKERFFHATQRALDKVKKNLNFEYLNFIPIKVGVTERRVSCDEIVYFSTKERTCFLHLKDKVFTCSLTLKELEANLDPNQFLRVHRNTIINCDHIDSFSHTYPMLISVSTGEKIQVSKERRKHVKDHLSQGGETK